MWAKLHSRNYKDVHGNTRISKIVKVPFLANYRQFNSLVKIAHCDKYHIREVQRYGST